MIKFKVHTSSGSFDKVSSENVLVASVKHDAISMANLERFDCKNYQLVYRDLDGQKMPMHDYSKLVDYEVHEGADLYLEEITP